MSKEEVKCDSCNQPMKLVEKLKDGVTKKNLKYRRRRFFCSLCNINKTVYANGQYDNDIIPYLTKKEVDKMYKEQERNNESI